MKLLKIVALVVVAARSCCFALPDVVKREIDGKIDNVIGRSIAAGKVYLRSGTSDGITGAESINNLKAILVNKTRRVIEGNPEELAIPAGNLSGANVNYLLGESIAECVWKRQFTAERPDIENVLTQATDMLNRRYVDLYRRQMNGLEAAKRDMRIWCSDTGFWDAIAYLKGNLRTVINNDFQAIDEEVNGTTGNPGLIRNPEKLERAMGEIRADWEEHKMRYERNEDFNGTIINDLYQQVSVAIRQSVRIERMLVKKFLECIECYLVAKRLGVLDYFFLNSGAFDKYPDYYIPTRDYLDDKFHDFGNFLEKVSGCRIEGKPDLDVVKSIEKALADQATHAAYTRNIDNAKLMEKAYVYTEFIKILLLLKPNRVNVYGLLKRPLRELREELLATDARELRNTLRRNGFEVNSERNADILKEVINISFENSLRDLLTKYMPTNISDIPEEMREEIRRNQVFLRYFDIDREGRITVKELHASLNGLYS